MLKKQQPTLLDLGQVANSSRLSWDGDGVRHFDGRGPDRTPQARSQHGCRVGNRSQCVRSQESLRVHHLRCFPFLRVWVVRLCRGREGLICAVPVARCRLFGETANAAADAATAADDGDDAANTVDLDDAAATNGRGADDADNAAPSRRQCRRRCGRARSSRRCAGTAAAPACDAGAVSAWDVHVVQHQTAQRYSRGNRTLLVTTVLLARWF